MVVSGSRQLLSVIFRYAFLSSQCWFCWPTSQEAKTSVLDMAEDDPHAVEGLLIYVYTLEYPEWVVALNEDGNDAGGKIALKAGKSTVPTARWETHLSLFKLADKICLRKLKAMAKKRLQSIMHTEWTLGSFHQLLEQLWHMQHVGVEELKAVAMKVVSANAADLMVKPQFRDLLSDDSSFNIDLINELISGPKGTSTGVENELMLARQRGERNRNDLQEVANSWATGPFCSVTNKGNVGRVLENWDKT